MSTTPDTSFADVDRLGKVCLYCLQAIAVGLRIFSHPQLAIPKTRIAGVAISAAIYHTSRFAVQRGSVISQEPAIRANDDADPDA